MDGETNIIVLDDDINIVGSFKTPGGGCATVHDGILYVGTGPRDSKPHRFNNITQFTLPDCRPVATMTLDYGVETRYAAQCLASDGKSIYAVFYATNGGDPCVILTSDLKIERLPEEYCKIMQTDRNKKYMLFEYYGYEANGLILEYTVSYHDPEYTKFSFESIVSLDGLG